MDLIYEGITTSAGLVLAKRRCEAVRMDLIYEGITTRSRCCDLNYVIVRMDLIYEGITTS